MTCLLLLGATTAGAQTRALWLAFNAAKVPDGTVFSGELRPSAGQLAALEPWLFVPPDQVTATGWQCTLRGYVADLSPAERRKRLPAEQVTPPGVLVHWTAPAEAVLTIATSRGEARLSAADLDRGQTLSLLDGLLRVTTSPPVQRITDEQRAYDYPTVALGPPGRQAVACVAFDGSADRLLVWADQRSEPVELSPAPGDFHQPALAYEGDTLVVVWPAQIEPGNFELLARRLTASGPGPLLRLTRRAGTDFHPCAARTPDGRVWLVWQSWSGTNFDIRAGRLGADGLEAETTLSSSPFDDWAPAVCCAPDGSLWAAWDSYRHGSFDVYLRRFGDGAPGPEIPVAATPSFEAHAAVAATPDGTVWVAYDDGGPQWGQGRLLHAQRHVRLRGWQRGHLVEPLHELQASLPQAFRDTNELPALAVGPRGELHLLFRRVTILNRMPPDGPKLAQSRGIWNVYACCSTTGGWSAAAPLASSSGRNDMRTVAAGWPDGEPRAVFAADGRQRVRAEVFDAHHVQLATLPAPTEAAPPVAQPVADAPDEARLPAATPRPRPAQWTIGGHTYRLVLGDTHRHTDLSRCVMCQDGSLEDTYRYAIDVARLDFLGISDHDQDILRHRHDRKQRPFDGYAWWRSQKWCDLMHHPDVFCTLFGYEHGGSFAGRGGHQNVMYAVRGRPCEEVDAPEALFKALGGFNVVIIPHQLADGTSATDWSKWSGQFEPVAELFQARGSYEHADAPRVAKVSRPGCYYQDALARGQRVGAIASSDHGLTSGAYAGVWVSELSRTAVLDGLRAKRTYGATAPVHLELSCGDAPLGAVLPWGTPVRLRCRAVAAAPLKALEIVRDGKYVYSTPGNGLDAEFTWADAQPTAGSYYYLRASLADGGLAWSSPLWCEQR